MSAPARVIDRPEPGFFKARQGKQWLPAVIRYETARDPDSGAILDRSPKLRCYVGAEERDPHLAWPWLRPVDRAEYDRLCLLAQEADPHGIPDFGQSRGHNSGDAELKEAAEMALALPDLDELAVVKIARLVKAITAETKALEDERKRRSEPHKKALGEIKAETECQAAAMKEKLCDRLAAWLEEHWAFPDCAGVTPYARDVERVEVYDPAAVPREFLVPDVKKIEAAHKAGQVVPGVRVVVSKRVSVV